MSGQIVRFEEYLTANRSLSSSFTQRRRDKGVLFQAERTYALEIMNANPDVYRNCNQESVGTALLDLATTGLTLSPRLGLAYLVPYKGQVKLEISYKGMEQMCFAVGLLKDLNCDIVREGDTFLERHTADGPNFEHIPQPPRGGIAADGSLQKAGDERLIVAAYCMARFTNGGRHFERMYAQDLRRVVEAATAKNKDKNGNTSLPFTYKLWLGEMLKKAVIRRAWKHWPKNQALQNVIELVDRHSTPIDFGQPTKPDDEDGGVVTISDDQVLQLQLLVQEEFADDENLDRRVASWMKSLAESFMVREVGDIPAPMFDQAVAKVTTRIEKVREARA